MNAAEWTNWINGWCARPLEDVTGYRSGAEIDAVSTVGALSAAVELHIMRTGRNLGPEVQRIGEIALESLRELRRWDPHVFVEYSAALLGMPVPPPFDHDAYIAWCKRQEVCSDG